MKFGRYGISYIFLRLGVGLSFLWIGIASYKQPTADWTSLVPIADAIIGLLFIFNYWPRVSAFIAAACLVFNLYALRVSTLEARDIGILGAALAILFWPYHPHRRRWWRRFWPRRSAPSIEEF